MSDQKKTDRRVERTITALRDALMALIVEKGYDAISIQDIADRANVARATFYLHFRDKDDLMFSGMKLIYDQLAQSIHEAGNNGWEELATAQDFIHVGQYADFYAAMLSPRGSIGFLGRVRTYLQDIIEPMLVELVPPGKQPNVPLKLLAAYCAGAQIGMIWWWVENRMPIPAKEMAQLGMLMSVRGLTWAVGETDAPAPDTKTSPPATSKTGT
ncbi:MAG: TetR/AcrR family transcriptional regulator [Anaerolineae bacterium]|jgi:AcrR family transcriptional regulator|nr:TetR/AcrR family transcriptional regulator [Anaerolineae bacterium]